MINVFLAEDHKIMREGLRHILEDEKDLTLVGEAENGKEAAEKLEHLKADVALVDINMSEMDGVQLTKHIVQNYTSTKVLILSMLENENYVSRAFEAGASGYLLKSTGKVELVFAIRTVASGETYISNKLSLNMIKTPKQCTYITERGREIRVEFSKREIEILNMIAEGCTNEEIADKTFTSKRTVENHRKNMIERTGSRNSASLIRFALTNGIIK